MKKLVEALLGVPLINGFLSLLTYIFYGAVLGIALAPSAMFLIKMHELLPIYSFSESLLNIFLFSLCIGVAVYLFFVVSTVVFGIFERILTLGFKPGRYSTGSITFVRWIIYSGLHVLSMYLVMPYISGTIWSRLFYKILGAKLGKNVFLNSNLISDAYLLEVGDNVVVGGGASVSCHIFEGDKLILGKIKIGSNSLIGADSYVMPGATIGNNCNVGIKAIIRKNRNVPDKSMILAFPGADARKVAQLIKDDNE